jgi:hypothetical protein
MIRFFLHVSWSLGRPPFQSKHPPAIKVLLHRNHEDDQSLTLYDEVFLKTRNLFGIKKYQIVSKRFPVLVFLAFLSGVARKNQPILVLELFVSEARIYRMSERLRQDHQQYWINRVDCRQSKLFLQGPSKNQTKFLLNLKRQEFRLLVSVVTGHCTLNNHMKTMRLANSPTCAKCLEEDETVEYFVCRCPIFSRVRRRTLGDFELRSEELISADLKSVLSFIKAKV